jgi:hypothetical protein
MYELQIVKDIERLVKDTVKGTSRVKSRNTATQDNYHYHYHYHAYAYAYILTLINFLIHQFLPCNLMVF